MTNMNRSLDRIAHDIDRFGIGAVEADVAGVVDRARTAGVSSIALSVLADRAEPEIARGRAFSIVAMALAGQRVPWSSTGLAAAAG